MKKIAALFILFLIFNFTYAQDTIIKYNGDQIRAKITEITGTEIKYKKFDFQDGPLYIELKSTIKLIKYANGLKEEFQSQEPIVIKNEPSNENSTDYFRATVEHKNKIDRRGNRYKYDNHTINERDLHHLLMESKDKRIIGLVQGAKDARAISFVGFGAIPFGMGALIFLGRSITRSVYNTRTGRTTLNRSDLTLSGICVLGAIACPITSGIYKHKRTDSNREAVKLYNEKY